jgi:ankyrin repeat protein
MPDYKQGPTDPRFYEFRDAVFADRASAEKLLAKDPQLIAVRSSIGETAMHYLAVEDELESVEWLLDRGADVNTRNDFGETPLMNAASLGYFKMCELLLKRGADLEARDSSEETAISKAAQSGEKSVLMMLLGLLPAGADINAYFDDITADITLKHGGEIAEFLAARGLKGFYERYE